MMLCDVSGAERRPGTCHWDARDALPGDAETQLHSRGKPAAAMGLEFAQRLTARVVRGDKAVWDHLRQPGDEGSNLSLAAGAEVKDPL